MGCLKLKRVIWLPLIANCPERTSSAILGSLEPNRNIKKFPLVGGEFKMSMNIVYTRQTELSEFPREEPKTPFDCMSERLCNNRLHYFWKKVCSDCKKDFESRDGKPIVYKDFCGNPYCKDKECLRYRVGIAKLVLKSYFYAFPTWRERNQRWIHLIVGQKRIKKITSDSLSIFRKNVSNFLNFLRKELRNPHLIAVQDQSFDGETYYFHYHVAMRIRGHMDYDVLQNRSKKHNLVFHKADGGYSRKSSSLINYFSKRFAGSFEHANKGTGWMYADNFSLEEYFHLFHRKKRFLTRGFDSKMVKKIKKEIKDGLLLNAVGVVGSFLNTNNRICQYCNSSDYKVVPVDDPNKEEYPPPPITLYPEEPIEIQSFP